MRGEHFIPLPLLEVEYEEDDAEDEEECDEACVQTKRLLSGE